MTLQQPLKIPLSVNIIKVMFVITSDPLLIYVMIISEFDYFLPQFLGNFGPLEALLCVLFDFDHIFHG